MANMTEVPEAVRRFLHGIETGEWDGIEDYFTHDALYDASMPGWRYQHVGPERIARELREEWTGKHTWRFQELSVAPTSEGVVVDFEVRGRCDGDAGHPAHEEGCRMANIFRMREGRIAEHRYYCCGEWDEETLRRIDAMGLQAAHAS